MELLPTSISGLKLIKPKVFGDERGYFFESFHKEKYAALGIDLEFVQDNRSSSTKGVLRGLHFQKNYPQGKLMMVTSGEVLDVAVDLRKNSETFGQFETVVLSGENKLQFYIPPGFAHGFMVLSDTAEFQYKCTDFYHPEDEGGIIWNDAELNIPWPDDAVTLSEKDKKLPGFAAIKDQINFR
ncbi:dTDP-4-dehydrorhamnose 3,5-epimerase [Pantoea sp. B65]|uniref:dTDP-4-dehydrorhamnose 3,5-epimerase n=1 Tax=Pantoea sp. B65 TaxID=2813359 RepID=UPI0039B5E21A